MKKFLLIPTLLVVIAVLLTAGGWLYMRMAMNGFSARAEPSKTERMMALYARATAMPASAKGLKNPVHFSPEVQQEAMTHYADHCAVCHANNGSGQTMFGKGMYPKPPDLRLPRTQNMSDGELFYILENGIRMSGMPAFGAEGTAEDSWKLVLFIRHLPKLSSMEEGRMESLNPHSPDELQEEKEEQEFLNGGDALAKP